MRRIAVLAFVSFTLVANPARSQNKQQQAAAARLAIQAARVRLDSVLRAKSADGLHTLAADGGATQQGAAGTSYAQFLDSLVRSQHATLIIEPKETRYCLAGGFETGKYTYGFDDGSRLSRSGAYGFRWDAVDGTARLTRAVFDTTNSPKVLHPTVACETWSSMQLREARVVITAAPGTMLMKMSAPNRIRDDGRAAGYGNGYIDGACTTLDPVYFSAGVVKQPALQNDGGLASQITAQLRIGARYGAEIIGSPTAITSCTSMYSPATKTGVTTDFAGRLFEGFVTKRVRGGRIGLGPSIAHASIRTVVDTVYGAQPGGRIDAAESSAMSFGLGALAGYTAALPRRMVADVTLRYRAGTAFKAPTTRRYQAPDVSASAFALAIGLGLSR